MRLTRCLLRYRGFLKAFKALVFRHQKKMGEKKPKKYVRWPGIEPGSTAWKAAMLTTIPPTLEQENKVTEGDILVAPIHSSGGTGHFSHEATLPDSVAQW